MQRFLLSALCLTVLGACAGCGPDVEATRFTPAPASGSAAVRPQGNPAPLERAAPARNIQMH